MVGTESCRQPKFYKITLLFCFCHFCFSFLHLVLHQSVGPLSSETSEPTFWAFQRPLLFRLFCWISFILKINTSTLYLLLKEDYHFTFLIILQSQVAHVTLNCLGRQSDAYHSTGMCYYIIMMKCVFLLGSLCLSVDYSNIKAQRNVEGASQCFLITFWFQ